MLSTYKWIVLYVYKEIFLNGKCDATQKIKIWTIESFLKQ